MRNKLTILSAGAALALTPISAAMAETVGAKADDAVATAWVPATQAEQQAARGGVSYYSYYLYSAFSMASLICTMTGRSCFTNINNNT